MKLRPLAHFQTDIPSDSIEDENDFVQFGGRNLAEAVGAMLTRRGYRVSPPRDAGFCGWDFEARKGWIRFWMRVTEFDEVERLLFTRDMTMRFWTIHPSYEQFLSELSADLNEDPRFHHVGWTNLDGDEPHAPSPIER